MPLENLDPEMLIACVQRRPAVWDRRNKLHSNREYVQRCWNEISNEMDCDESTLRKKWKYLRDQFSVEIGKYQKSQAGSSNGEVFKSKWQFFHLLTFLKEVVKVRPPADSSPSAFAYLDTETIEDADLLQDGEIRMEEVNIVGECEPRGMVADFKKEYEEQDECSYIEIPLSPSSLSSSAINRRRLQKRPNDDPSAVMLEQKKRVVDEDDEDMMFFRSMMSHIKRIPDSLKLSFRCRLQEVVEQFAYPVSRDSPIPVTARSFSSQKSQNP